MTTTAGRKLIPFPQRLLPQRSAPYRSRDEREFLPAALEIIETPVSRAGRIMMGVIGLLVVIAIVWACIGKVDIVATANGRIVPIGEVKQIQPMALGVVKEIAVRANQHVAAGDVLVKLDPTTDTADRDRIARDLMQARLDIARLRAVLAGSVDAFVPPAGAHDGALVTAKRQQLVAQLSAERAKIDDLDQQIAVQTADRDEALANIEKYKAAVPLLRTKETIYKKLLDENLTSEVKWLDVARHLSDVTHEGDAARQQWAAAKAQIAALRQRRGETEADFRTQTLAALSKVTQYAAEQRAELVAANERTRLQTLRAPVGGTVENLAIHSIGGVVKPAQTLMTIVPDDAKLEVKALLPNGTVGFVHAGEPAQLKVEAFPYTRYGVLHGRVLSVSADASRRERNAQRPARDAAAGRLPNPVNTDSAYTVRISLPVAAVQTEQGRMPLMPGMTVTAEVKTGHRHVISYLLSPFERYREEALTER